MSLTKEKAQEERLASFYSSELLPIGSQVRKGGKSFFLMAPDPGVESYFIPYSPQTPEFESIELGTAVELLRCKWEREKLPELAAVAPKLIDLAIQMRDTVDVDDGEVSPLIYVMF